MKIIGIETIAQLQKVSEENSSSHSGPGATRSIAKRAAIDAYEFFVDAEPKSISHNQTFGDDTRDREQLKATLSYLCQKAVKRMRDSGLHARTVTLTLRFEKFVTITRNHTLPEPSDLDSVFLQA